jgi:ribosomal protein L11 methyltransferase
VAVDNDKMAMRTARANGQNNRVSGLKFIAGDIHDYVTGTFDIITANLYSDLLRSVLPRFQKCLYKEGRLILSGVLRSQETEIVRALKSNRFRIQEIRRRGKWVALLAGPIPKT